MNAKYSHYLIGAAVALAVLKFGPSLPVVGGTVSRVKAIVG